MRSAKYAVAFFAGTLTLIAASRSEASGFYSLGVLAAVPQAGQSQYFTEYWGGLHHSDPGTHTVRLPLPLTNPNGTTAQAMTVGAPTIYGSLDTTSSNVCIAINSLDPSAGTYWSTANGCAQLGFLGPSSGQFSVGVQPLYVPPSGHAQAVITMQGPCRASTVTWTN